MKTSKVHAGTVVGVLALPLIAVLAMVMFFSFSQSGPNQAQAADQGTATAMEIRISDAAGAPTAKAELDSKFTISVAGNLTPADPISAFGLDIVTDGGLNYSGSDDCTAETKGVTTETGASPAVCISQASFVGGHLVSVVSAIQNPPLPALDVATGSKVVLANLSYTCKTTGVKKITLTVETVDPDGALYGGLDAAPIPLKTEDQGGVQVADSATVECIPAGEQININVVDADLQTQKLADTCWAFSYTNIQLSPPETVLHDTVCDNGAGTKLFDKDSADGSIRVDISGNQRAEFGDIWSIQQTETNTKYDISGTKLECNLSEGKCDFLVKNAQANGNLTVTFFDNRVSGPVALAATTSSELCVNIATFVRGDLGQFCAGVGNDFFVLNMDAPDLVKVTFKEGSCVAPLEFDDKDGSAPSTAQLALGHAASGEKQISASFSCASVKVFHLKTPELSNLFLTNQQGQAKAGLAEEAGTSIAPQTCRAGTDVALFTNNLSVAPGSEDPKGSGNVQRVAAFEMEVRYDPKWVCVNIVPGDYWFLQANKTNPFATGNVRAAAQAIADSSDPVAGGGSPISLKDGSSGVVCFIDDKNDGQQPTGLARIGCVTTGKVLKDIDQTLPLAYVLVKPQPEVYNQIIPNQENGIVTMILNAGCNLADDQGHPIDSSGCDDSVLTIRWLEADFNGDCKVDVIDQQMVSSRWGAKAGSLLYNARMDTMPFGNIQGDQRIDIKDVQFAFGRNGSECSEQNRFKIAGTPHPDQDPADNK